MSKQKNCTFNGLINKMTDEIQLVKFDLKLIITNEKSPREPQERDLPKLSVDFPKSFDESAQTATLTVCHSPNSIRNKGRILTNITPKKHQKPTHRSIKSMKLEINKKLMEDKIGCSLCLRPGESENFGDFWINFEPRSPQTPKMKKRNTFENILILTSGRVGNKRTQRKSVSPRKMKTKKFQPFQKLKEQNLLYSNLFEMRMKRRRNTCR